VAGELNGRRVAILGDVSPDDLPAFCDRILQEFARSAAPAG
jgi:hypothetical protein